jgi:Tn3 transposase DDE domain
VSGAGGTGGRAGWPLRADTIAAANAALIEAQGRVPIVEHWGEGLLASVSSLKSHIS